MNVLNVVVGSTTASGTASYKWQPAAEAEARRLAVAGDGCVDVYDSRGQKLSQVQLPGRCNGFGWSFDGQVLASISSNPSTVVFWKPETGRTRHLDIGISDIPTAVIWSRCTPLLAVGTEKGNLWIYNQRTQRQVLIVTRHSKRITAGDWSDRSWLALIGEDRVLTISNEDGDSLAVTRLRAECSGVRFAEVRREVEANGHNCVSLILDSRHLFLVWLSNDQLPITVKFQESYGLIVDYHWIDGDQLLVGFSNGVFAIASASVENFGKELVNFKLDNQSLRLTAMAVCLKTKKLAVSSGARIKVKELGQVGDSPDEMVLDVGTSDAVQDNVESLSWSDDGQYLTTVFTKSPSNMTSPTTSSMPTATTIPTTSSLTRSIRVFLISPAAALRAGFGSNIAFMTNQFDNRVLVVKAFGESTNQPLIISTNHRHQPSVLAVGSSHVALASDNHVWLYSFDGQLTRQRDYPLPVEDLKLNKDFLAALVNGQVILQRIVLRPTTSSSQVPIEDEKTFPEDIEGHYGQIGRITTLALTNDFLIFGTDAGTIEFFLLEDWIMVNVHKHIAGIKRIIADAHGTRIAFIDIRSAAFVFNAVTEVTIRIPDQQWSVFRTLMWDEWQSDGSVLVACDANYAHVFVSDGDTTENPSVGHVGQADIPQGHHPMLLNDGIVACLTDTGRVTHFVIQELVQ